MIFVTGATGFLGAYITHYLVGSGARVRALKRSNSPLQLCQTFVDKVEWVDADINDTDALLDMLQGVNQIYHIAGLVSFDPQDRRSLYRINHVGTQNIVNAAIKSGVKKILYASSISAIGRSSKSDLVNEETEWLAGSESNSAYGDSKRLGEMEVWRAMAEGMEGVVVNPSIILGSGYWKGSLGFTKTVDRGLKFYPAGKTGLVDVRDVADICIKLMNSDISAEKFILSAQDMYYKDFLQTLARHLGVTPPSRLAGPLATELVWRMEWLRSKITARRPIITKKTARFSQKVWTFSNEKICQRLNYEFREIVETIAEMCQDYLSSKDRGESYAFRP